MNVELLIIDPQNSFCDPNGALSVPGGDEDMERLAKMIRRTKDKLDDIHVTLDTHHLVDVAHPVFWIDSDGNNPDPLTIISHEDVKDGVWKPVNPAWQDRMLHYTNELESNGRYKLCIWPPHCLIGTEGHNVYPAVADALLEWEEQVAMVDYVTKGSNFWTEHYSAVQADVPDPSDPSTQLNTKLIETLQNADLVGLTGQALSHCVKFTVTDIVNNFGDENISKLVFLEDTSSPVPGFEQEGQEFIEEMKARGMKTSKAEDFLR